VLNPDEKRESFTHILTLLWNALTGNWLRVLGTAERSQIHQGVCHQLYPVVPLLDTFKS